MGRFTEKIALVTGAASGIGRAMALRFAAEGARVVAVDLAEGVRDTAAAIEQAGGRAHAVVGDAASPQFVDEAISLAETLGGLDIACANAGISGGMQTLAQLQVEDWERVLRVNLIGPFVLVQRAAAVMVPRGRGSIVCTASVAGLRSGAGGMPYSASKAGVISLVQTAANQLAGTGVRINAICPGLTETGMTQPIFDGARARGNERKLGQLNPLRRAADPEEPAALALFLASDDASYVNGQAIAVDGGLSSSHPVVLGHMF
jgi:NAD(P)-dependent dehydrogenase (short-subunit alcohol dehydrogenase family)